MTGMTVFVWVITIDAFQSRQGQLKTATIVSVAPPVSSMRLAIPMESLGKYQLLYHAEGCGNSRAESTTNHGS
jgi:hypothetical protein